MNRLTPIGVADFLPNEAQNYASLLNNAFKRVKTPTLEYLESLEPGLGQHLKKKTVKFIGPNGATIILRPDNTIPLARMVATHFEKKSLPQKFYYQDPIFRRKKDGNIEEQFETGVELVGLDDANSDFEIIKLCIETLHVLGIKNFGIDMGHVSFIEGLSSSKKDALIEGNYLKFGNIPERGNASILSKDSPLKKLSSKIDTHHLSNYITYNKGLVKSIHYYTGIIFEAYAEGYREPILSGGRYDKLISKFGLSTPAIGFALNINVLKRGVQ